MRTVVSWAWFRPSEKAWDDGARWYRCDVVGGGDQTEAYVDLPETAEGLLLGRPDDDWMVCAAGPTVTSSVKVPCSQNARLAGGHHDQARRARRRLPRRPAGRGHDPRLLLGLGRRLAELPGRLRLRLHLVPRGRVGGRQPPLGLLGEDRPVTRRRPGRRAVAPGRPRCPDRLHRRRRTPGAPTAAGPRRRGRSRRPHRDARRPARPAPRPRAGACYRLTYDEAVAPTTQAEPGRLPPAAHRDGPSTSAPSTPSSTATCSPSTPDGSRRQVAADCPRRFAPLRRRHARATRRLSMLRAVWFTPTRRAVRRRRRLVPLRRDRGGGRGRAGAARRPARGRARHAPTGRDRYGMCGTAEPGADGFERVICCAAALLAGDRDRRRSRVETYPGEAASARPARPLRGRRPAPSPPTRWTSSGATSGPPASSGRPASATASAGPRPDRARPGSCGSPRTPARAELAAGAGRAASPWRS